MSDSKRRQRDDRDPTALIGDGSDDNASTDSTDSGGTLAPESVSSWDDVRSIYGLRDDADSGRYAAVCLLRDKYDLITVRDDADRLLRYDEEIGIYERGAEFDIGRELDRELGQHYSQHERREIISRLKEHTVEREVLNAGESEESLICVANGVLDVETREIYDHDPEYLFTTRIPVEYDPDAEPEAYDEFTNDITRRDADAKTLNELLGNALLDDYRYEYVLFLFGDGANGKSTWLSAVRALLGDENTSSETLQRLAENRFSSARLVGKMANIAEDLPQRKINDMGTIKDLSGGGMVPAERKNQDPFDFANRAKLMFAANSPPVLGERTWAVKRRLAPIYLPYRFVDNPDDDDPHEKPREYGLEDQLTSAEELSGILNRALDGLDRLRANGDISLPESPDERLDLYERHSDHIKAFRVDCLTNTDESTDEIPKDRIYNAYTRYCEVNGEEPTANTVFWKQLRRTTLDVETYRPRGGGGKRPTMLQRVAWKEMAEEYLPADCEVGSDDTADDESGDSNTPISDILEETATATIGKPVTGTVSESGVTQIGDGSKIQLVAGYDVVDVIDWDADHDLKEYVGKTIQIIRAQAGEYDGTKQIELIPESVIKVVEEPTEDGQTGLDDAADDDEPTQAERISTVRDAVGEMAPVGDGALAAALADDYDPETVKHTLEKLAEQGDIHDPDGDGWRTV
ncbi:DNA primase family protein [Haloferax larsenii]|uniref:Phage/plasmid primase, P4 family, C-terminal domain-containing protein n=1 Tax=Haloferax larsenii TaxID=302484 RepID=A0A1H7JBS6_HALLR|nr:DNA primase family protein [Haloferax larsenii]SEK70765.1 phage/plasmid primase, P4 family, C-terminal domain-containing protein [Haloferax larsenii]